MIDRLVMKKKTHKEQHMNHNAHVTINISCRNRSSYMVWSQKKQIIRAMVPQLQLTLK